MSGVNISSPPSGLVTRITTATTTTIRASGRTVALRLIIGATAAGTISIQAGDSTVLALFKASMPEGVYELGFVSNGLKVVTGAASDITIVYL
jgi:hypothetical protein